IRTLLLHESTILEEEKEKTIESAVALRNLTLFMNGLIILITIGLSIFLMRIISKPIIKLSDFAANINYENLHPLLPILTNDEIGQLQKHLNMMLINLDKAKRNLIETSRSAGIAEIATSVLHNVGNVLNSINTSVTILSENCKKTHLNQLPKLLAILENNKNCLDHYINQDERGKLFIPYFGKLIEQLKSENIKIKEELNYLNKNLIHVNQIIAMQQDVAGNQYFDMNEPIQLEAILEDILLLFANTIRKLNISIERQYTPMRAFLTIKSKVQQIIINLIKNAIDALAMGNQEEKNLIIKLEVNSEQRVLINIIDNGIGIVKKDFDKIFSFGFTTKKEGHGYGLHNCAFLAKELGGELQVQSEGLYKGSVFTLNLPATRGKRLD
ncbi:MAG: HAMP domain-containing histidine kinase, partial [Tatlockia sp.]|nr:HAMP domain-containing histidine kinase [Tatlockia sp.]